MTPRSSTTAPPVVVWDLGNVLIPWDRHGAMFAATGDHETARALSREVFTLEVNELLDRGTPTPLIRAEVEERTPGHGWVVDAYLEHFRRSLGPQMEDSAALLARLVDAGHRCVGLSNWSATTFGGIQEAYPALQLLEDILISGDAGVTKPDAGIFRLAENRFGFAAGQAVLIDDSEANVEGATSCGWDAILFTGADALESELLARGLLAHP